MKKHIKKYIFYSFSLLLGIICLIGGIVYSRYIREGMNGVFTLSNLLSKSVTEIDTEQEPVKVVSTLSKEKIISRIDELEKEIVNETNDPDRASILRAELYDLKKELSLLGERK